MLSFEVWRGKNRGIRLTPHLFRDGTYHVERKKGDTPIRVKNENELRSYVDRGYHLRMSNREERLSPSLIAQDSIQGR
jgi:hypothetical protein